MWKDNEIYKMHSFKLEVIILFILCLELNTDKYKNKIGIKKKGFIYGQ